MPKQNRQCLAGPAFLPAVLGGLCLLGALARSTAQTAVPGQVFFGRSNYVEYVAGDLPVIFSAPHGGGLKPAEIPDRVNDGSGLHYTTATDSHTEETAFAVQAAFASAFGHQPHIIVCQLKRSKVDCNRALNEGVYHTNVYATIAWHEFQDWINTASNAVVAQSGFGFYIDLHGQNHPVKRLELGYLLTAADLTNSDAVLDQGDWAAHSSIRTLAGLIRMKQGMPFSELLRGTGSFGALMAAQGFPAVPDPDMPSPGDGDTPIVYPGDKNLYFDGGYNVNMHTSRTGGGPVDGLQIEANYVGVRDTPASRARYGIALARTLDYFFKNYYGLDLRLSAPCRWIGGAGDWGTAGNWVGDIVPVSGNYLLFSGGGGVVRNDLPALTSGAGTVHSLVFGAGAAGGYLLCGDPLSVQAGVTNLSACPQIVSNSLSLLANQSFCAAAGPLGFCQGLTNGGFTLSIDARTNVVFDNSISGSGGLAKLGNGSLTLNAASFYSGATTNQAGLLLVHNQAGCANGSGALFVSPGAVLAGSGGVSGPVRISGVLAPGDPAGTLTITNGLTFAAGGGYHWTLAGTGTNEPSADFGQVALSGGNLLLDPDSPLVINFTNSAVPPATNVVFWQSPRSWKIIALTGTAANPGHSAFKVIDEPVFAAGKFVSTADARGNVFLNFVPAPPPGVTESLPAAAPRAATPAGTVPSG